MNVRLCDRCSLFPEATGKGEHGYDGHDSEEESEDEKAIPGVTVDKGHVGWVMVCWSASSRCAVSGCKHSGHWSNDRSCRCREGCGLSVADGLSDELNLRCRDGQDVSEGVEVESREAVIGFLLEEEQHRCQRVEDGVESSHCAGIRDLSNLELEYEGGMEVLLQGR